jgi:hypothetical protein
MGGAVAICAFASDRPPAAERLLLLAPAVWGWSSQPLPNKTLLWITARVTPDRPVEPPGWLTSTIHPSDNSEEMMAMGRQLAMHVAATNPVALDLASVDPEVLAREKAILADKNAGKPANVLEKIVESGMKSYAKEYCLLDQAYIHDTGKSVGQALKDAEGKLGGPVKLTGFARFALGEGIAKEETDFAAEVAAAAGVKA